MDLKFEGSIKKNKGKLVMAAFVLACDVVGVRPPQIKFNENEDHFYIELDPKCDFATFERVLSRTNQFLDYASELKQLEPDVDDFDISEVT